MANEAPKKVTLNGSSIVLPLSLAVVIFLGALNLAVSISGIMVDQATRETVQDSKIHQLRVELEALKEAHRLTATVDLKLLARHQTDIEVALKAAGIMEK